MKFHLKMTSKFLLLLSIIFIYSSADAINVTTSNTYLNQHQCTGAFVNTEVYLNDPKTMNPSDLMRSSKLLFVRSGETEVQIWENSNGILSSECKEPWSDANGYGWARHSNVVPGDMNYVSVVNYFGNRCLANKVKRTNTSLPSVQFVYKIAYKEEQGLGTGTSSYYFYPFTDGRTRNKQFLPNQTKRVWGNIQVHLNECENFTFLFCGDGIVQTDEGETCDDGNNIDGDGCNNLCGVEATYDLALRKTLANETPGPFNVGDTVTFDVRVFNQGNVDSGQIEITDYIPNGLTLNDSNWTQNGNTATRTISNINAGDSSNYRITFRVSNNAPSTIKNFAEISSDSGDDCDSTPDNTNGNGAGETEGQSLVNDAVGNGCNPGGDEDDHDVETINIVNDGDEYDLALRKTLATTGIIRAGDIITFNIEVFNQGNVASGQVEVSDYIPSGLTLNDSNWSQNGSRAVRGINNINAGSSRLLTIQFRVNTNVTSNQVIKNFAEISSDSGDDCDSTPDTVNGNGDGEQENGDLVDDAIGNGCNPGGDEDDHDIAIITIDGGGGSSSSSSSSSSGGSPARCQDIINNNNGTYSCFGNNRTRSIALKCGVDADGNNIYRNPVVEGDAGFDVTVSGLRTATFSCGDSNPVCYVKKAIDNTINDGDISSWTTSAQCTIQSDPFCGDGVVQPERGEQCDLGSNNGKPGFPCSASCKLNTSSSGGGGSSSSSNGGGGSSSSSSGGSDCDAEGNCVITFPNGGEIQFGPVGDIIVGHQQSPFGAHKKEKPFIYNNSDYDLSFDKLCIKRTSSDSNGGTFAVDHRTNLSKECMNIENRMIYAYSRIEFQATPQFEGNKNGVSGTSYGDGVLTTSLEHDIDGDGIIDELYNAYFAANLNVRVAKPAIVTTGGGTSYVKNSSTTSDVSQVTKGNSDYDPDANKNFVGASASNSSISSFSESVTNSGAISTINDESDSYTETVEKVVTTTTGPVGNTTGYSEFKNYNGLDNVYILTGKNVTLSNIPAITESTTYIIEGGDLIIKGDMITNINVAYVVKGGDIKIEKTAGGSDVTRIDGTYISMEVDGNGGNISSNASPDQLVVNGSLYGDLTDLVANRYYIDSSNRQLGVGTIVSFGSSIFTKPAPLVSQFIGEYLESEKVAR